jgi:hypothetical protein
MPTVRAEEYVPAAAAMLSDAGARLPWMALYLGSQRVGEKGRKIDRQMWLPVGAPVRVVLRRQPVELAPDLAEVPLDVISDGKSRSRSSLIVSPQHIPV